MKYNVTVTRPKDGANHYVSINGSIEGNTSISTGNEFNFPAEGAPDPIKEPLRIDDLSKVTQEFKKAMTVSEVKEKYKDIELTAVINGSGEEKKKQLATDVEVYQAVKTSEDSNVWEIASGASAKDDKEELVTGDYIAKFIVSAATLSEAKVTLKDHSNEQKDYYLLHFYIKAPKNSITMSDSANGSFTVKIGNADVTEAEAGQTVTVTATPSENYEEDTVTVKDANNDDIAVTNNTFEMPENAVTITVTFKEKSGSGGSGDNQTGGNSD